MQQVMNLAIALGVGGVVAFGIYRVAADAVSLMGQKRSGGYSSEPWAT